MLASSQTERSFEEAGTEELALIKVPVLLKHKVCHAPQ